MNQKFTNPKPQMTLDSTFVTVETRGPKAKLRIFLQTTF